MAKTAEVTGAAEKRYGRWSSEAREQWDWIKKLDKPVDAVAKGVWLNVMSGSV